MGNILKAGSQTSSADVILSLSKDMIQQAHHDNILVGNPCRDRVEIISNVLQLHYYNLNGFHRRCGRSYRCGHHRWSR